MFNYFYFLTPSFHQILFVQKMLASNQLPIPEETMMTNNQDSPFKLKMQLLRSLKEGDIENVHKLLCQIKEKTKINEDLYEKFHNFVQSNKQGLLEMQREEKEENESSVIIVDDDEEQNLSASGSSDGEEDSESSSSNSQSEEDDEKQNLSSFNPTIPNEGQKQISLASSKSCKIHNKDSITTKVALKTPSTNTNFNMKKNKTAQSTTLLQSNMSTMKSNANLHQINNSKKALNPHVITNNGKNTGLTLTSTTITGSKANKTQSSLSRGSVLSQTSNNKQNNKK